LPSQSSALRYRRMRGESQGDLASPFTPTCGPLFRVNRQHGHRKVTRGTFEGRTKVKSERQNRRQDPENPIRPMVGTIEEPGGSSARRTLRGRRPSRRHIVRQRKRFYCAPQLNELT
jgi:hypothetical protein